MLARNLISHDVPELTLADTVSKALDWMEINRVEYLPVIDKGVFLGFVVESEVLGTLDISQDLAFLQSTFRILWCAANDSIFDVMRKLSESDAERLAVIDENGQFLGCVELREIFRFFAKMPTFTNPGGVITLEMNAIDYSMGEISRLVESNDVKIIGALVSSIPESHRVEIILKLNKTDLNAVIKTFERFNYTVTGTYTENAVDDTLQRRYDELMRYLGM